MKRLAIVAGLSLSLSLSLPVGEAQADEAGDAARDAFIRDQRNHMTVLGAYALGSVAAGVPMLTSDRSEIRAAGLQNLAWGAVDGVIALVALGATNNLKDERNTAAHWADERSTSRRIFAINAGLDVLYVATGALLLALGKTEWLRGTGAGVLVQGGFLLAFDTAGAFVMAPR